MTVLISKNKKRSQMTHKNWTLYVLKLEQKKYYVGITSQTPEKRFQEHLHGRKTYWMKKYPPIKIIDTKYLGDLSLKDAEVYEDRVTRRYIKQKGINNVRGGDLTSTSDYVVRFGYIFNNLDWKNFTVIFLEYLIICSLVAYIYLK